MLHIVQLVLSGSAETPQIFCAETAAHAAFVECTKRYWAQSYAAYCERNGVSSGDFSSAERFVASFDLADRSRIHYWVVTPEDAGSAGLGQLLPGGADLLERRERVLQLAREVEQASGAIRERLAELLDAVATLGSDGTGRNDQFVPTAQGDDQSGQTATFEIPPPSAAQDAAPPSARKYDAGAWKAYVQSVMNMCGGNRGEFHLFTRHDWRQAVYGNETGFEYWEWVAVQIDEHVEKARNAGYSVVGDPDQPGYYRFRTPDGTVSDSADETEDEAWCRAGLHLERK
jgi:hypothetical protein